MKRFRIALVAGLATLALGALVVPVASASGGTTVPNNAPALKAVPVHGKAQNGKQFTGTYAVQRFVARGNNLYAVGTVKGTLNGRRVARYNVMTPAKSAGSQTGAARTAQATGGTCTVLNLTLGPIDLNLLGLHIQLFGGTAANGQPTAPPQPITLLITANPSQGLLGQLLCNLTSSTGGLTGTQLAGVLSGITQILTALGL